MSVPRELPYRKEASVLSALSRPASSETHQDQVWDRVILPSDQVFICCPLVVLGKMASADRLDIPKEGSVFEGLYCRA